MARKAISLEDMRKIRPVNEKRVAKGRDVILSKSRAMRLAEFRKSLSLTQVQIAELLGVDQSNVSRIEHGNFSNTQIGTLQAYIEALGGTLEIHAKVGKKSHLLTDSDLLKSI